MARKRRLLFEGKPVGTGAEWKVRYNAFKPSHTARLFRWKQRKFLSSITPNTRVLEIGAGSGRIAEMLLKHTRLRPENLTLVDLAYGTFHSPALKKRVFSLALKGKVRALRGNIFEPNFMGREKFDKILVPEAFFPPPEFVLVASKRPEAIASLGNEARMVGLARIISLYFPRLAKNGELYVSTVAEPARGLVFGKELLETLGKMKAAGLIEYDFFAGAFYLKRL